MRLSTALAALLLVFVGASGATAVELRLGDILVADQSSAQADVLLVDPATGAQTGISPGNLFVQAMDLAIASDGALLVVDRNAQGGTGAVIRVDPATEAQTLISSGQEFANPVRIAIGADGELFVVDSPGGGPTRILSVDPVTGLQTVVSSGGSFIDLFGLTIDARGKLLVGNRDVLGGNAAILRVDPALPDDGQGGNQTTVSSGGDLRSPNGLAIDANGDILVADSEASAGAIIRVDPVTGGQTVVSSGGFFQSPFDVSIEADGSLLVVDLQARAVIRVDPASGTQALVSSGGFFLSPVGIALVLPVPEVRSLQLPKAVRLRNASSGGSGSTVTKTLTVKARIDGPYTPNGESAEATVSLSGAGGQSFTFDAAVPGVLVSTANAGTAIAFDVTFDATACDSTPVGAATTGSVQFSARVTLQSGAVGTASGVTEVICRP